MEVREDLGSFRLYGQQRPLSISSPVQDFTLLSKVVGQVISNDFHTLTLHHISVPSPLVEPAK